MEDESKKEVEQPTIPADSTEEIKDNSQKAEETAPTTVEGEDSSVKLSKEEHEKLLKKATDFDNMVKSKRFAKLAEKGNVVIPPVKTEEEGEDDEPGYNDREEIIKEATDAAIKAATNVAMAGKQDEFKANLSQGYDEWIQDNKWADSDETVTAIADKFVNPGTTTKADLIAALDVAAMHAFPLAYREAIEAKARKKILAETANIDAGDGGSGSSVKVMDIAPEVTKEDQRLADKYFGGDVARYLKHKKE